MWSVHDKREAHYRTATDQVLAAHRAMTSPRAMTTRYPIVAAARSACRVAALNTRTDARRDATAVKRVIPGDRRGVVAHKQPLVSGRDTAATAPGKGWRRRGGGGSWVAALSCHLRYCKCECVNRQQRGGGGIYTEAAHITSWRHDVTVTARIGKLGNGM